MSVLASWWRRALEFVRRAALDRQSAEELAHHIELLVAERRRAGLSEADARRAVRLEHGAADRIRVDLAAARTGGAFVRLARDGRLALRGLRRARAVAVLSIATLAVGLAAAALIFALVSAIALRPLPFPDPDRLVRIFDVNPAAGAERAGGASGNIDDWRRRATTFDGLAGYFAMGRTIGDGGRAEVVITAQVTRDFFDLLRIAPLHGRLFDADDFARAQFSNTVAPVGADPVVLIAHGLWRSRFGADPAVVGRTVTIERRSFRVVGVMPAGFLMPDERVQMWLPWDVSGRPRDQHYLGVVARLKPNVTIAAAESDLNRVAGELAIAYPASNRGWSTRIFPLRDEVVGATGSTLWLLLGAVITMLVVVCANVALLSLMRGADRAREFGVRLVLGATVAQLRREALFETALLAVCGGVAAGGLATLAATLLPRWLTSMPRIAEVTIDSQTIAFLGVATAICALVSSLPAAWRAGADTRTLAPSASLRVTAGLAAHRLRDTIAAAQIALAVVLLAGATVAGRGVMRLAQTDSGFDAAGVLVAPIFLDGETYRTGDHVRAYYATLFEQLAAIPGVTAVGGATSVPTAPLGPNFERPVWRDGTTDAAARLPASVKIVTSGYFDVLRAPLIDGRQIDQRDSANAPGVVMVNETLAARLWPGARAVGQRMVVDYSTSGTYPYDVVGVVGDIRSRGPRSAPQPELYFPHAQRPYLVLNVVIRSNLEPAVLVPAVRTALAVVDPQKPAHDLYTLDTLVSATYARDRGVMAALSVFGTTAIVLAMIGVFGVLAQRVRERGREIGIRIAIGADASTLTRWIGRAALRMLAPGLAAGVLVTLWLSRAAGGLIVEGAGVDGGALLAAATLVAIAGAGAAAIPAWRAVRVDPVVVLRRDN